MSKLPQISEAEFEVMKVIWKYAPISTNEVTEKLTQKFVAVYSYSFLQVLHM